MGEWTQDEDQDVNLNLSENTLNQMGEWTQDEDQDVNLNLSENTLNQMDEWTADEWNTTLNTAFSQEKTHIDDTDLVVEKNCSQEDEINTPTLKQCCSKSNRKMTSHLAKSSPCKRKFCQLLDIPESSTVDNVMKKRAKMMRKEEDNRQTLTRRREYNQKNWQRNSKRHSLIETRKKVLSNEQYYVCYECSFMSSNAEKFNKTDPDHPIPATFSFQGKFYKCKNCVDPTTPKAPSHTVIKSKPILKRIVTRDGAHNIMAPVAENSSSCDIVYPPLTTVPSDIVSSTNWEYEEAPKEQIDLKKIFDHRIGSVAVSVNDFCNSVYENTLSKIKKREDCNILKGVVVNEHKKTVHTNLLPASLHKIAGTTDYDQKLYFESQFSFLHFGTCAFSVTVELNKVPLELWKSFLCKENKVAVFCEHKEGSDDVYTVHEGHGNGDLCDQCTPIPLADYLRSRYLHDAILEEPCLLPLQAEYFSKIFSGYTTFIRNLDAFKGHEYLSSIYFPIDSDPQLKVLIWPNKLYKLNEEIAQATTTKSSVSFTTFNEASQSIGETITTTTQPDELSRFGLTDAEVELVVQAVQKHQYDEGLLNESNPLLSYPSNHVLFKQICEPNASNDDWSLVESHASTNALLEIRNYFGSVFRAVKKEHFLFTSTVTLQDVLQKVSKYKDFKLTKNEQNFHLKLPKWDEELIIPIDGVLQQYLDSGQFGSDLSAIYHRSLTISKDATDFSIILKRKFLHSCLISGYNPHVLLLTNSVQHTAFVGSHQSSAIHKFVYNNENEIPEMDSLSGDHKVITLLNAMYWLGRDKFKTILRSSVPSFFDPQIQRKLTFKKIKPKDYVKGKHYVDVICTELFAEFTPDVYTNYLQRNGLEQLCFYQFYALYKDQTEASENSQDSSPSHMELVTADLTAPTENLPDIITLSSNKQLLRKKKPSLLYYKMFPQHSDEFIESQVFLFHPHKCKEQIADKNVRQLIFNSKHKFYNMTNIEFVRLKLLPFFNMALYSEMAV